MPEAVDRLQLVADGHQLRSRPAQRLDQAQLQAVGVLELVDQEVAEPAPVGGRRLGPLEQSHRQQLQVLEVDPGAPRLGEGEALGEQPQELGDVAVGEAALAGLGDAADRRVDRLPVGGHRLRLARRPQRGDLAEARAAPAPSRRASARSTSSWLALPGFSSADRLRGGLGGASQRSRHVWLGLLGKPGLVLATAAQLGVHAEHDPPQPGDVECRDRVLARAVAAGEEGLERLVERLDGRPLGLGGVQHAEAGIDARRPPGGPRAGGCRSRGSSSPRSRRARAAARGRAPIRTRPGARPRPGSAGAARPRPCR